MAHAKSIATIVRYAVATVESTFCRPHLARMDVTPANTAEHTAKTSHIESIFNYQKRR